jgi:hypothetical protein
LFTFDDLLARYRDAPESEFRVLVARALVNKADALFRLRQIRAGFATYRDLVVGYGDAPEADVRGVVRDAASFRNVRLRNSPLWDILRRRG